MKVGQREGFDSQTPLLGTGWLRDLTQGCFRGFQSLSRGLKAQLTFCFMFMYCVEWDAKLETM